MFTFRLIRVIIIIKVIVMSEQNKRILDDVTFFLECEGLYVTDEERQRGADMLEGKISLDEVIADILEKGRSYAGMPVINK